MNSMVGGAVPANCCAVPTPAEQPPVENSLSGFMTHLFDTSSYPPRWNCGTWTSLEGWLHIVSDLGIFVAYFAIPFALIYFVRKRKDVPCNGLFLLFTSIFLLCGASHLLEAVIFYAPLYRVAGLLKLATAIVSMITFLVLLRVIPRALDLPGLVSKNELLRRTDALKSQFLANMSHEIRTPMTAILGYAEVLNDTDVTLSKTQQRESIDAIKRNGEHLLNVINDVLDLSKIEAGKLQLEMATCSPGQIVDDVIKLLSVRAAAKGIELVTEESVNAPDAIVTDPTRVRQVLINVVGNAIKFTETGSVRIGLRGVHEPESPPLVAFDVTDTGIGISQEALEGLFTPFTQADASTTRRFGGTGLGLSICKRLATALGGGITVKSVVGQGSTFSILISATGIDSRQSETTHSIASSSAPACQRAPTSAVSGLDCRVLLVEDGVDNQRLVSMILKKAGAKIEIADNGQIGVEAVTAADRRGEPFDVVLMDMQMPVKDGYEATEELRSLGVQTPIIAVTAHAMSGDREKCLAAGCTDFATKPINRAQLIELVRTYAGQTHAAADYNAPDAPGDGSENLTSATPETM